MSAEEPTEDDLCVGGDPLDNDMEEEGATSSEEEEGTDSETEEEDNDDESGEVMDDEGDEDESEESDDEDENSEEDEEEDEKMAEAEDSNSDGTEGEVCPICLNQLRRQDIGTPESCDHSFCLECIQEWAKNVNTCPVDRQVFNLILARHCNEEKIFKQIPVENKQQADGEEEEEEEEEDPTYCQVCYQADREDRLLLCDTCDQGYHCDCLNPPLAEVPVDEWFCPRCQSDREEVDPEIPRQMRRQIARTRVSERVRRVIADARQERAERRRRIAEMSETEEDVQEDEGVPGPSTSSTTATPKTTTKRKTVTRKKRKTTRKKTTTRKRKTTKRKSTGKKTTKRKRKGKGKAKRKSTKRKTRSSSASRASHARVRTASIPPITTVKGRIADKLGLSRPPTGRSIPLQKTPSGAARHDGAGRYADSGSSSFSILGKRDELYNFAEHEGEERQPVSRPAIPADVFISRSARSSHTPLCLTPAKRKVIVSEPPAAASSSLSMSGSGSGGGFDILGSIMQNQDLLHKGSKHVIINRDGSLTATNARKSSESAVSSGVPVSSSSFARPTSSIATTSSSSRHNSCDSSPVKMSQLKRSSLDTSGTVRGEDSKSNILGQIQQGIDPSTDTRPSANLVEESFAETASSDEELANLQVSCADEERLVVTAAETVVNTQTCSQGSVEQNTCFRSSSECFDQPSTSSDNRALNCGVSPSNPTELDGNAIGGNGEPLEQGEDANTREEARNSEEKGEGVSHFEHFHGEEGNHDREQNMYSNNRGPSDSISAAIDNHRANSASLVDNVSTSESLMTAVAGDSIMKRNLNLLVSSMGNLAGFESGEEDRFQDERMDTLRNVEDREEGEASDDGDEDGEIRDSDDQGEEDEHEEGEIVEEEEEWPAARSGCVPEEDDSGGLDVNAIHVEEMEMGTFRKRSMSRGEDNGAGDTKKLLNTDEEDKEKETDKEPKKEISDEESSEDEEDEKWKGSFQIARFLASLLNNDFERKKQEAIRREEERMKKEEAEKMKKAQDDSADKSKHMISILDFIGSAGSKFGLPQPASTPSVVSTSSIGGHGRDHGGQQRDWGIKKEDGSHNGYNGSFQDQFERSTSRRGDESRVRGQRNELGIRRGPESNVGESRLLRRRDNNSRGWRDENRNNKFSSAKSYEKTDRWRRIGVDGENSRFRSHSQDSRTLSQRSGSYESGSSKSHRVVDVDRPRKRRRRSSSKEPSRSRSPVVRRGEKRSRSRRAAEIVDGRRHEKERRRKKLKRCKSSEDEDESEEENNEDEEGGKESDSDSSDSSDSSSPEWSQSTKANGVVSQTNGPAEPPPPPPHYPIPAPIPPPPPSSEYLKREMSTPPNPHSQYPPLATAHVYAHASQGQPVQPRPHSSALHPASSSHPAHPVAPVHPHTQAAFLYPTYPQTYPASYYTHPHSSHSTRASVAGPPTHPHSAYTTQSATASHPAHPHHVPISAHPHGHPVNQTHLTSHPRPAGHLQAMTRSYPAYTQQPTHPTTAAGHHATQRPAYYSHPQYPTSAVGAVRHQVYAHPYTARPVYPSTTASSTHPTYHHYPYAASISKQDPLPAGTAANQQKVKRSNSPRTDGPLHRASYRISPPPSIRGVATSDRLASNILHDEVKKGFRQLVEDAVRSALKSAWSSKKINKDEYKDIFKKAIEKVTGSKETVVHQEKIQSLIDAYVLKARKLRTS